MAGHTHYTIRSKFNASTATVDFVISFSDNDGFIDYLIQKKGLKKHFNALTVAASKKNNSLKVTMPFGTDEKMFREKAKGKIEMLYNLYSLFSHKHKKVDDEDIADLFGSLFGG